MKMPLSSVMAGTLYISKEIVKQKDKGKKKKQHKELTCFERKRPIRYKKSRLTPAELTIYDKFTL